MNKSYCKVIAILSAIIIFMNLPVYTAFAADTKLLQNTGTDSDVSQKYERIIENDSYILSFNPETAQVLLTDKASGYTWYSNYPDDALSDMREKSQLIVYYYENNDLSSMNTYESYISAEDQMSWSSNDSSLTVEYNIGDSSFSGDALPMVLTKQRMEKDIFPKLNAEEREIILDKYTLYSKSDMDEGVLKTIRINFPTIDKNDLYIRTRIPDYIAEEIYNVFRKAGYTNEDLQRDCDENKVENTYTEKPFFRIEMTYTLNEDGFKVTVNPDNIKYIDDYKPCRIDVLPYFGCAADEDGYMIVPDGCGAVIEFNNGKTGVKSYWKKLFEKDLALVTKEDTAACENSVLPYFVISKNSGGVLATVDSGYEAAGISADVARNTNHYNHVYSFYDIFSFDKVSMDASSKDEYIVSGNKSFSSPIEISYHFMTGSHKYSDYAVLYRKLLIKDGIITEKNTPGSLMNIDFIGTAEVTKRFLGIPYQKTVALTTYRQAYELIEGLNAGQVNAGYKDALKGGVSQRSADNVKLVSALGKASEREKLAGLCSNLSVSYYGQYAEKISTRDSAMTLGKSRAKLYKYNTISRYVSTDGSLGVVAPLKLRDFADKIIRSMNKTKLKAVNLLDMGYQLNSNFDTADGYSDRYMSRKNIQGYLSAISEKAYVSADVGSIFSLPYLSAVKNIPVTSSGYLIEDYPIPFYEIAVSGCVDYSVSALNTAADSRRRFLNAVELGAGIQYIWAYTIPDNITSDATTYYKYYYKNSYNQAQEYYSEYLPLYKKISGRAIVSHEMLEKQLFKTAYDNGLTVYVNYGDKNAEIDGLTVKSSGFAYRE